MHDLLIVVGFLGMLLGPCLIALHAQNAEVPAWVELRIYLRRVGIAVLDRMLPRLMRGDRVWLKAIVVRRRLARFAISAR